MKLKYQFTPNDLRELASGHDWGIHQRFGSMIFRRFAWVILPAVGVLLATLFGRSFSEGFLYIGGYSVLVWAVWGFYERTVRSRHSAPQNRSFELREWTLNTSSTGITFSNGLGDFSYRWAAIAEVNESRDYVFLWYSLVGWIAVPKRAFASETQLEEFKAEVNRARQAQPEVGPNGSATMQVENSSAPGVPPSVS